MEANSADSLQNVLTARYPTLAVLAIAVFDADGLVVLRVLAQANVPAALSSSEEFMRAFLPVQGGLRRGRGFESSGSPQMDPLKCISRHRSAEQKALHFVTLQLAQERRLLGQFDTFSDDL
jgi:hypothetical protein